MAKNLIRLLKTLEKTTHQKRKLDFAEIIRFHDLRHTNATLMLNSDIPAKIASERLGHSTIGITLDLYSHVLKDMQEEAVNKLDRIIFNSVIQKSKN